MATTLTKTRTTPGVYITEFAAFPPTVVGVATAVPIFVGYTQTAMDPASKKQLYFQAIPIASMSDYYNYFGYGFDAQGVVDPQAASPPDAPYDFEANSSNGSVSVPGNYVVGTSTTMSGELGYVEKFNLYASMQLFFANGGGNCFVVSCGNYWGTNTITPPAPGGSPPAAPIQVTKQTLLDGLAVANDTRGPTMIVVPDACLLTANQPDATGASIYGDYQVVVNEMLRQAYTLQDRVAIIDLPAALDPASWTVPGMAAERDAFYATVSPSAQYFSYGAAYGPALESSFLGEADVTYTNLQATAASTTLVNNLLTTQALELYPEVTGGSPPGLQYSPAFIDVAAHIAAAFPVVPEPQPVHAGAPVGVTPSPAMLVSLGAAAVPLPTTASDITKLDQYLLNALPLMGQIQKILASKLNVIPPSGVMAGIWTQNDANRGVWNAPANMSLNEVIAPMVALSDEQQGSYNAPLNGMAIDILRAMVNRGTVVWGARTLEANSLDYKYIQVRRTLIYIEQSIKMALQQFVFAANDGGTWATVTATISNFLTQLWQAGGLMGDKASDAFTVKCGVPTTMSGLDVLNGYMIVNVTVQMIHPAEFIELTFTQTMEGV